MKIRVLSALCGLSLLCVPLAQAQEEERDTRVIVAPEVLGFFADDSSIEDEAFVGMRLGMEVGKHWLFEIESGWVQFDIKNGGGHVESVPLLGNVRYYFGGFDCLFDAFIMGGLGGVFNTAHSDGLDADADGAFAGQAGGGFEWRFAENWAAVVEARYMWNDTELTYAGVKSINDFDAFVTGGSLVYRF